MLAMRQLLFRPASSSVCMPPIFLDMIWLNYNRHVLAVISWTDLYNAMPALELGPNEINIFSNETSFMFHSGDSEGILRPPKRITSVNQCLRPPTTLQPYLPQRMLVHRMVAAESTGHYLPTLPIQSSREKTSSRTFKNIIVKYCLCLICVKLVENDSYVVYSVEIYAFVKCCVLRLRDAISQGG